MGNATRSGKRVFSNEALRLCPDTLELAHGCEDDFVDSGAVPELRFCRTAAIVGDRVDEWNNFLNKLGKYNYGKGNARSLGSMACSFVTATEMGRMLEWKYPKIMQNRSKTIQLYRRLAKHYATFVRSGGNADIEMAQVRVEHSTMEESMQYDLDMPIDEWEHRVLDREYDEPITEVSNRWNIGSFATNGFSKYSRNGLGIDMSSNEGLMDGFEKTIEFLKGEKLNTDIIDQQRRPHLVVFDTFAELGKVDLRSPIPPTSIVLEEPRALSSY